MKALQFSVSVPQWAALKALGLVNKKLFYRGPLATVKLADVSEPALPSPAWVKIKTLWSNLCNYIQNPVRFETLTQPFSNLM